MALTFKRDIPSPAQVRVLDRLPEPPRPEEQVWGDPDRSYNLGLGGTRVGLSGCSCDIWQLGELNVSIDAAPCITLRYILFVSEMEIQGPTVPQSVAISMSYCYVLSCRTDG